MGYMRLDKAPISGGKLSVMIPMRIIVFRQ
jgi:hypothetical protein